MSRRTRSCSAGPRLTLPPAATGVTGSRPLSRRDSGASVCIAVVMVEFFRLGFIGDLLHMTARDRDRPTKFASGETTGRFDVDVLCQLASAVQAPIGVF